MPESNVIGFSESIPVKTTAQGAAFIELMRRQLDRYGVAFPGVEGQQMEGGCEQKIRRICDDLEREIREKEKSI